MSENTQSQVEATEAEVDELESDEDEDGQVEVDGETYVKLYTAARVMNALWEEHGSDRRITPQQLYGPAKKGNLPGVVTLDDGKRAISLKGVKELWEQANSGVRVTSRPDVAALAAQVAVL
jgi:hypothetical protein